MKNISIEKTEDKRIPAVVTIGKHSTPVWLQSEWEDGPHAFYIKRNGCGHCCAAMALRLCGVSGMDPEKEYEKCIELWGAPDEAAGQDHFQTVKGIVRILNEYGVKAEAKGVKNDHEAALDIYSALENGKFVIFWSSPREGIDNPFSTGEHYVMAAGLKDGTGPGIVILNSGTKCTSDGVQFTDIDTVEQSLFSGSEPSFSEWGWDEKLSECGGYVTVEPENGMV